MDILNNFLKICFILSSALLLFLMLTLPKTDCQACEIKYNGREIDGYKAFEVFEENCISYDRPETHGDIRVDGLIVNESSEMFNNVNISLIHK